MLFNSHEFVLAFLPVTVLLYYFIRRHVGFQPSLLFLAIASLFFYGWWDWANLKIIGVSIVFNFIGAKILIATIGHAYQKALMLFFVGCNLASIGFYKYLPLVLDETSDFTGIQSLVDASLPLAISFFTFQQISYLVDAAQGKVSERNFANYVLYVTFFPQLIAGPIVHHSEMMPQFSKQPSRWQKHLSLGIVIFIIGLAKKVLIADNVAEFATPVFTAAAEGQDLNFWEAWIGALAYHFQIYFDFSGYSDMALGLGRMFCLRLPVNFYSPYKATSIVEFWRRWHITLSRFLRDYLYIPLGGNRGSKLFRFRNIMLTMLLGGLWHGAGLTFVIWGGLHGVYLVINHLWASYRAQRQFRFVSGWPWRMASYALTMFAVVVAWVFFRASSPDVAFKMVATMFGLNGFSLPAAIGPFHINAAKWIALLSVSVLLLPNTLQVARWRPLPANLDSGLQHRYTKYLKFRPDKYWATFIVILGFCILMFLDSYTEFLYFQF